MLEEVEGSRADDKVGVREVGGRADVVPVGVGEDDGSDVGGWVETASA